MRAKVAWCVDDAQRQRTPDLHECGGGQAPLAMGSQKRLGADRLGRTNQAKP